MQLAIFKKEIPDDIEEIGLNPPAIERLQEVEIPVQVMVGDLDLEEKQELADRLASEIPQARNIVMPGMAHMLNMEGPELFNHSALGFLARLQAT